MTNKRNTKRGKVLKGFPEELEVKIKTFFKYLLTFVLMQVLSAMSILTTSTESQFSTLCTWKGEMQIFIVA